MNHRPQLTDTDRISIGVSSCLLGNKVRYDGSDRYSATITEFFTANFQGIAICPETGIGLGVPRPPIQLIKQDDRVRARGVEDRQVDVTDALENYAQSIMDEHKSLYGFIVKARSPSCGMASCDLFDEQGRNIGKSSGIFVATLLHHQPTFPVIDDELLEQRDARARFIQQVKDYHRQHWHV